MLQHPLASEELPPSAPGKEVFVRTLAGGGPGASSDVPEGRFSANLVGCSALAYCQKQRAIYFNDSHRVRRLDLVTGLVSTLGSFEGCTACCVGDDDTLYVAGSHSIHSMRPCDGSLQLLAGDPNSRGMVNAAGRSARFAIISSMACDGHQRLVVTDGNLIRLCTKEGSVTTLSGDSQGGFEDGSASAGRFQEPKAIAYDAHDGSFYVADTGNRRIRKISSDMQVSTIAGDGRDAHQDGHGTEASLRAPTALTSVNGWVYVIDSGSKTIRCISPDGEATTVAGVVGATGYTDCIGSAAKLGFTSAGCLCTDRHGHYVFVDCLGHDWNMIRLREFTVDQNAELEIQKPSLQEDLSRLLQDATLGDLTILSKDGKACHSLKGLLCLRSEYFKAMLDSGFQEGVSNGSQIELQNSHEAIRAVLHFLHTDLLEVTDDAILEVLQMAEMMTLARLKSLCEAEIMQRICPANVCVFFAAADRHGAAALRRHCLSYVANHLAMVRCQDKFKALSKELLLEVMMAIQLGPLPATGTATEYRTLT